MNQWLFPDLVHAFMAAKIIHTALELRLPDLLAEAPQTTEAVANQTDSHEPSLRRLLRALASLGVVDEREPDRFVLTEFGQPLRDDVEDSVGALVQARCAAEFWQSWAELTSSIRTGNTAWELAHDVPWLEFYERHPAQWAVFNKHMARHTRQAAPGIIEGLDFSRFDTVVDVGGGDGTLLAEILRAHSHLQGVLLDLPGVVTSAGTVLAAASVAERCRVVDGDFFVSVPKGGDAYVMKFILHDWDDDRAIAILRNCRRVLTPEGRVLIVERVLPEPVASADARMLLADVLMLVATGGRERTEMEFRGLLERAGLALTALTEPLPPFSYQVIEAAPAE